MKIGLAFTLSLFCVSTFAQVQTYRATKLGYCGVKNGKVLSQLKWVDCNPNVAIIVDFSKGNVFVNSNTRRLFKIVKTYPPKYTTAYTLFKYDTKDSTGNTVGIALTHIKNENDDYEIGFTFSDAFYVYQMTEALLENK